MNKLLHTLCRNHLTSFCLAALPLLLFTFNAAYAQPAISISKDASGKTRTFLASQFTIPTGFSGLFYNVDNSIFTCTLVQPLKEGDTIATIASHDQSWSAAKTPLLIGTDRVQYPIFATMTFSNGNTRAPLPAVLKFKIDIKAGAVLHSTADAKSNTFIIETKKAIKAGDSIPVLFINGPSILSVEATAKTKASSGSQPWFIAFVTESKPDDKRESIEAWRIEKDYVGH